MSAPLLFREDSYAREAPGIVVSVTDANVALDASLFYPAGGGQPGDQGRLTWDGGQARVVDTVKGPDGAPRLVLEGAVPPVGTHVTQLLDWDRRYGHMRVHTALHLLSVVLPMPVTGGAISAEKGRLDFAMAEPVADKPALETALQAMIDRDLPVAEAWISDADLAANPGLVKTMSVTPPSGQGRVRLIRIGSGSAQVDLQPCGGTHVARTGEIGRIRIGKIEKKGAQNRRVALHLLT